jgi:hypothetical protein
MRTRTGGKLAAAVGAALLFSLLPNAARADEPAAESSVSGTIDLTKDTNAKTQAELTAPPPEAPPAAPYKKTLVLDSSVGAMTFLGQFGKVAPPGPWLHTQLGYELLSWVMIFGEGDLAFTDTSNKVHPPEVRAFPMFGFGGGARFTARFTDRFGVYAQGSIGAFKADVGTNTLGLFGFRDAESLGVYLGARLGIEWYQVDRHFALGLNAGVRTPQGFAKTGAGSGTPIALDGGVALRYAF